MKAVQIQAYGDQAVVRDARAPTIGPREVSVRVAGYAANPLDLKIGSGVMRDYFPVEFPYTLGTDLSGTVVAVGDDVTGWSAGDRVVARLDPSRGGAAAEYAVVPADQLVRAPSTVSLHLAAGIVTAAATAWQALTQVANIRSGQTVLVHGGAGGVGSFAVQFARDLGAQVITTASGAGVDIAQKLGAHQVIDYTETDFTTVAADVDVVLDTIGGVNEVRSLDVLRSGGILVATPVPPDAERATSRGVRAEFVFHSSDATRLATVVEKIDSGTHILLDRVLPLGEAPAALDYLADGKAKGKVVLVADSVV
ncbi:NADP-dependent oxidoreductase [Nocardia sp. NPDC005998]|uniref:NADP-dependent oxidoreductase n=1 Tax=Nocardia sp. NPDC005998 TaxID=3156894 RepID=UPI0033BC35C6